MMGKREKKKWSICDASGEESGTSGAMRKRETRYGKEEKKKREGSYKDRGKRAS